MNQKKFAFGQDEEGCRKCPAIEAGVQVREVEAVVDFYDSISGEMTGIAWGVLPKKRAVGNWEKAIDKAKDVGIDPEEIEKAEEILEEIQ